MSAQAQTQGKAPTVAIIGSLTEAKALADHLINPTRARPAVLVTSAAGQSQPYIDVDEIIVSVSDLADVYLLPTGSITFALSDRLPPKAQVYGGAGRVYPVDSAWQSDPFSAPLRFAFGANEGPGATDRLIADALRAVLSAGLDTKRVGATLVQVEGEVKRLIAPSRAWVRTDDHRDAAIWQDLFLPGLPIERVFQVGMRVSGSMDVSERRIDVSATLRKPGEALADYVVGAVVLGRVVKLDDIAACIELYPGVRTGMSAKEVTGNPEDRLTAVMSIDEVLPVRVTARGGHDGRDWRLSTFDVEDSEEILASPSLLRGGPPWLVIAGVAAETQIPQAMSTAPSLTELTELTGLNGLTELTLASPAEMRPVHLGVVPPLALISDAAPRPVPVALDERGSLRRRIAALDNQLRRSRTSEKAFQVERDEFRAHVGVSTARVQELVRSAKTARTDLRIEKQKSQRLEKQLRSAKAEHRPNADVLFLDPEAQFRYEVDVAYAHRIPAGDKASRPRHALRIGPDFLATLSSVEGVDRSKVVAVTVEIVTDLVNELDGRELHPLREGQGGADRDIVRLTDGARCLRVSLQRNTASARRLHYWKAGDAIELSRVVKHDDMTP